MIQDVSNKLLGQFAQCLQTKLAGGNGASGAGTPAVEEPASEAPKEPSTNGASGQEAATAPLDAGAVVLDVAKERAREKAPLLAGAAIAVLLVVLLRRRRG
jgi:hypothetical protein